MAMRSSFWKRQPAKTPGRIFITEQDLTPDTDDLDLAVDSYPGLLLTNPDAFNKQWNLATPTATLGLPSTKRTTPTQPQLTPRTASNNTGSSKPSTKTSRFVQLVQETNKEWASDDADGDDSPMVLTQRLAGMSVQATASGPDGVSYTPDAHGISTITRPSIDGLPPIQRTLSGSPNPRRSRDSDESGRLSLTARTLSDHKLEQRNLREMHQLNSRLARVERFEKCLAEPNVDLAKLRKLSWNGIPEQLRAMAWQLLMGFLPANADRRDPTLTRKRKEYADCVAQTFAQGPDGLEPALWHQIQIDVPRTCPTSPLFQDPVVQQSLARILYCWADRHPASGYVQGINDLVTPFYVVFLSAELAIDPEQATTADISDTLLSQVEADSFWCLSKLLDGIQDNYIHAQPGIIRQIEKLKELVARINGKLAQHLQGEGVEFIQFAFRWMNCLLMREVSLKNTVRMWDTYLEIMLFLQAVPTQSWTDKEVEVLLSEAFMWQSLFHHAPNHYSTK
ncbi:GTPase-activating protein [Dimargaris verticillata]|uniref:GTPase-activating protein n=1 Tax=Dimargaris verticillata TaxID=2761393 RepID=A0A9W8B3K8_9FUNG|nr:GTPase-activating protein [Dimargaris verticillata]